MLDDTHDVAAAEPMGSEATMPRESAPASRPLSGGLTQSRALETCEPLFLQLGPRLRRIMSASSASRRSSTSRSASRALARRL